MSSIKSLYIHSRLFIFSVILLGSLPISANVTVSARLDSAKIVIGEQATLSLTVNCGQSDKVIFPELKEGDNVMPGIEVVKCLPIDTTNNNSNSCKFVKKIVITSFDTASYVLPPFTFKVQNKDFSSQRLKLTVYSFPVDTANVTKYYPIKYVQKPPFLWDDWKYIIFNSIIAALFFLIIGLFYTWLCNGVPVIHFLRRKPKLPPHQVAMREINELKHKKQLAIEDSKTYYTLLTDALRTYIRDRYGFNALEMTSGEIIERLSQENDQDALHELDELFQTADLAKFAKYSALVNENDAHLLTAIDYVNRTKLEVDPNAKDEIPKLSTNDKKNIALKWTLRISIFIGAVVTLSLLSYNVYRIIQLLS